MKIKYQKIKTIKAKWIGEFKELIKQELDIPIRYIF